MVSELEAFHLFDYFVLEGFLDLLTVLKVVPVEEVGLKLGLVVLLLQLLVGGFLYRLVRTP